jgi:RNA polymerase sigma-70 factor (ECF subfamily)
MIPDCDIVPQQLPDFGLDWRSGGVPKQVTEASPHSAEQELLQQVRWIQGVAFAILRDQELAQDVSQEVLLKALSGERRKGRVLRAWLAAVTRNASISLLRERNRREAREFRAAQPEELAAIRNPLEILEAHESLTKAIHVLPADAREIILLRFFENLDFPAIAQRVGIREDAARVRLHRALGLLRNALSRKESGWQSWCALALPAGTSHLLPASSRIAELLLMKAAKPVAFVLAAGLLLLALIFGPNWRETNIASPDPATPLAAAPTAPAAADAGTSAAEPALERSAAPTADSAAAWTIRGQVRVASGGTEGGFRVRAILHDGYDDECPILAETVLTSAPDGGITWSIDPPAQATYVSMRPEAKGVGYGDARLILKGKDPPQDLELVVIHWTTPFSGVVRNEAGEPIPGALVRGGRDPATTDGEGRYEVMGRAGTGDQYFYAEADGYAQQRVIISTPASGPGVADFVLNREFTISGRVLDENGAPVEGAAVDTFGPYLNTVQTDAEGAFELRHLPLREATHHLYARKKGYVEAVAEVQGANRPAAVQNLMLKRGTRLEGRVLGPDGAPLEGANLYVGFSPSAYNRLDTVSHENGIFVFPSVPEGRQTLVAQYPGLASDRRVLNLAADVPLIAGMDIVLAAGHFVAGLVVDEAGGPLAQVWISVRHKREYIDGRSQTDADGRFRLEGLPAEDASLELYGEGLIRLEVPLLKPDQENLMVTMMAAGSLQGRVVDDSTGLPIQDFRIQSFYPPQLATGERATSGNSLGNWDGSGRIIHSEDGSWSSDAELEIGRFIGIEVQASGYSPARMEKVLVTQRPEQNILEFRLMPGAALRGTVLPRSGGSPVSNATVSVLREEQLQPGAEGGPSPIAAVTDEQGIFEFHDLPAGKIFLRVVHADWMPKVEGPIEILTGGQNAESTVYLDAGSTLRGRALSPSGEPLADLEVVAHGHKVQNLPRYQAQGRTDQNGRFDIPHLPPGRYEIVLFTGLGIDRRSILSIAHVVREGVEEHVLLQFRGTCSIHGRVTSDRPLPENLHVSLEPAANTGGAESPLPSGLMSAQAQVIEGAYEFEALEPGRYYVRIWGYTTAEGIQYSAHQLVDLLDGMKAEVNLQPAAFPK